MTNGLAELLDALRDGTMTLDQVAEQFRQRRWPRRQRQPDPASYLASAAAELQDPEPSLPGSFDEVTLAYDQGKITAEQYDVLARAMADAKRAESEGI